MRTVHGEGSAAEDLAGVAVAEDVGLLVLLELDGPLVVAAVALSGVRSHFCGAVAVWFVARRLEKVRVSAGGELL